MDEGTGKSGIVPVEEPVDPVEPVVGLLDPLEYLSEKGS